MEYQFIQNGQIVAVPDDIVSKIKQDAVREYEANNRDMEFEICKQEVIEYLESKGDDYFAERETTKEAVLADDDLIDTLAHEHHKSVYEFGCDHGWSVADCCDSDPGFYQDDE